MVWRSQIISSGVSFLKSTDDGLESVRPIEEERVNRRATGNARSRRGERAFSLPSLRPRLQPLVADHGAETGAAGAAMTAIGHLSAKETVRPSIANPGPAKPFALPRSGFTSTGDRDPFLPPSSRQGDSESDRVDIDRLNDAWFADTNGFRLQRSTAIQGVKRFFDVVFASIALVVCAPLFAVLALCIKLESRGPVSTCRLARVAICSRFGC